MNSIFTTSVGYDLEAIRPFVDTLRRNSDATLYILQAGLSEAALGYLRERNVEVRPWPDKASRVEACVNRFTHYLGLIESENLQFGQAMFTDLRDVIFQGDPFSSLKPYRIKAFVEELNFHDSEINRQWVRQGFGANALSELEDKPVICAGITLASHEGAIDYLQQMSRWCKAMPKGIFGIDQGVHNHLVYSGALNGVEVVPNRTGEVQTMAGQSQFLLDGQGRVLNDDGSVCPVLHQYDRHVLFGKYLLESMGFNAITADAAGAKINKLERILNSRSRLTKRWLKVMVSGRAPI